ncbi:major capsid protein [Jeotgalibacillus campisalis]|uniref:Coat protein n=1 Tax=Jeotgalibacillus campisalis TaxID=220754 RepID=A0A0C2VQ71_9BACL|nr:major capsid protein [Jeotgalibacillus campisalis]KIL46163.1 hypothetical protein KR50_28380 [Jeotgalibacillus campisalis]
MAKTLISDVIVPEVFNPYVVNRTTELSALYQSGIISTNPELQILASGGGRTVNMPFWNDLDGEDEVLSDTVALTPDKIDADQDVAVKLFRGKAWAANDLAGDLAGSDPMAAIGDRTANYWVRRMQAATIATLNGVFASSSMSGNQIDFTEGGTNAEAKADGNSIIEGSQLLGDAQGGLTAMVVHSRVYSNLKIMRLLEYKVDPATNTEFATFDGKRVIVDDGVPVSGGAYTSYLFGPGALGYADGTPADIQTETDRDKLAGDDILINRKHFILHPRGVAFTSSQVSGKSPSNADLAAAANWDRVYHQKQIRIVKMITNG